MKLLPFFRLFKSSAADIVTSLRPPFYGAELRIFLETTGPTGGAFDVNQVIGFFECYALAAISFVCERHLTQWLEGRGGITYNELAI